MERPARIVEIDMAGDAKPGRIGDQVRFADG
jgi:hypothetical protein